MIKIIGYHTCRENSIISDTPFLSNNKRSWLTQGYYFWTDSIYFAHQWGNDGYSGKYCIVKCKIEVENKHLLDLIGNVGDQEYFYRQYNKLKKKNSQIDVRSVIVYLRELEANYPNFFPYKAIKAQDNKEGNIIKVKFVKERNETMDVGLKRQQLCLFENAYSCIKHKK